MRSRTGCLTCRQRKLKCSEERPTCAQCQKAARECIPSSGITFRHQHNASMNGEATKSPEHASLGRYYSYKNTFDEHSVWLDIPKHVQFIHTTNPYEDSPSPELDRHGLSPPQSHSSQEPQNGDDRGPMSYTNYNDVRHDESLDTHGLRTLSTAAIGETPAMESPAVQSMHGFVPANSHHVSVQPPTSVRSVAAGLLSPQHNFMGNLDFILNQPASCSPPAALAPQPVQTPSHTFIPTRESFASPPHSSGTGMRPPETDAEISYLLRFYSEGPGLWMDLNDLGLYFSYYVPVKALLHPVLKYAAVALAAKALGRIRGEKPVSGGRKSRLSRTESYADPTNVDWARKGTEYYSTAIQILRERLVEDMSASGHEMDDPAAHDNGLEPPVQKRRRMNNQSISCPNSVELLVATAILGVYEFLDASNPEWSRHLAGAKSLLDIAHERMRPYERTLRSFSPSNPSPLLKAKKATFWIIARQDMLQAFINNQHTRIDTEDFELWREAGLTVDANGFVESSNDDNYTGMKEDLISNALVWLMMKLLNFMASGDDLPAMYGGGPHAGIPQRNLLDYWHHLRDQFARWYQILPYTFFPPARLEPTGFNSAETFGTEHGFDEVWFSIPMCASAMQHYHFSQVLLLMNKPHESTLGRTTLCARMNSYDHLMQDSLRHCREIVSIALSQSNAPVRIHGVQPLYTAGQCFKQPQDRQLVVSLLREIEADTGWATEYRVQQLLSQWQPSQSPHPASDSGLI